MRSHFRRYGWVYGVCAVLLAWPAILWRLQRIPPIDLGTALRLTEWVDQEVERRYGKPMAVEFSPLNMNLGKIRIGEPPFDRLTAQMTWGPSLTPEIELVRKRCGSVLDEWSQRAQEGIDFRPRGPIFEALRTCDPETAKGLLSTIGPNVRVPAFLQIQTMAKLRRIMVQQAIYEENWPEALDQLDKAAHVGDPIRISYLIGNLIAIATRAIAYGGYAELLAADPPPEVCRSALDTLVELRRTNPPHDDLLRLIESRFWTDNVITEQMRPEFARGSGINRGTMGLVTESWGAAQQLERFQSNRLRAWAKRLHRRHRGGVRGDESGIFPGQGGLRWTAIPSMVRFLETAIESEPTLLEGLAFPADLRDTTDPWSAYMLSTPSIMRPNWEAAETRARVTRTRGRLVELAFAARLYRHERGEWPSDVGALVEGYLPELRDGVGWTGRTDKTDEVGSAERNGRGDRTDPTDPTDRSDGVVLASGSSDGSIAPYGPFRIAWRKLDENYGIVYGTGSPIQRLLNRGHWGRMADTLENDVWLLQCEGSRDIQPVTLLAEVEYLRRYTKMVVSVEVEYRPSGANRKLSDDSPNGRDAARDWKPLEYDYARRVCDETTQLFWAEQAKRDPQRLPPDLRGANRPTLKKRTIEPPKDIRLTARLKSPERALVIWSPGPDGVDDGARVLYDPTNGVASRGDQVIFPEGY